MISVQFEDGTTFRLNGLLSLDGSRLLLSQPLKLYSELFQSQIGSDREEIRSCLGLRCHADTYTLGEKWSPCSLSSYLNALG